jgi:hypothetical protein
MAYPDLVPRQQTIAPVQLVGADDPAWDAMLEPAKRDVYHTAGYHRFARGSGEGEPFLVVVGDARRGFAWPYLLRRVEPVGESAESVDVSSVYGYPGPLAWGCEPGDPFVVGAVFSVMDAWHERGVVSVFTRFNPLLENVALVTTGIGPSTDVPLYEGGVAAAGSTVSVDLTLGTESARSRYGHDLRRQIRAARRTGLITIHDEDWVHLVTFADLYRATMDRNEASDSYYFDEADFRRLRAALAGRLHLLVTMVGEAVAAAGLFTEFDGIVNMHLAGSSEEHAYRSPTKVLVDDAIRWARERGNTVLHLGGGRGAHEDSLFWFKSRFSPRRHQFHTGRWIIDRPRYEQLTRARLEANRGRGVLDPEFFPAYRAPSNGHRRDD